MRRLGAICLCLGLTAPALAVDPPAEESSSVPWYRWLFLGDRGKPAQPKPQTASKDKAPPARAAAGMSKEAVARTLADEQRAYVERLLAISKIRRIADEQKDEEMLRQADELEKEAEEIYKQKTAQLPRVGDGRDDRALLERGRDDRPATAERPAPRRRATRGDDR